jgi:hypothetical protein
MKQDVNTGYETNEKPSPEADGGFFNYYFRKRMKCKLYYITASVRTTEGLGVYSGFTHTSLLSSQQPGKAAIANLPIL